MKEHTNVLLIDDAPELVDLYKTQLEVCGDFRVTTATDAYHARELALGQLFDVLVIDAKLYYRGDGFGGLRLADELRSRYGKNSIVVISCFMTAEEMKEYDLDLFFVDKRTQSVIQVVAQKVRNLRTEQYAFVAMPFDSRWQGLYETYIVPGVNAGGLGCVRADEHRHTRGVQATVLELIRRSKLVILIADDANPNAYYEAGYADALGKEVLIAASALSDLRVDVSHRNTLVYDGKGRALREGLRERIRALRMARPPGL